MFTMSIGDFINYIDTRLSAKNHGDSFWINDLGERISADTGYAGDWWDECMKPELLRKFGGNKMSVDYSKYLDQHLTNVAKGYAWIKENLPEILNGENCEWQVCYGHDYSKFSEAEYNAYDEYFYCGKKTAEVKKNFNLAWLHHIHNNPHHWQYWVLINDDPGEGMVILDMPHNYIIEMICDWWAFSWAKGNLYEIFKWYDQHKAYMKLSDKTRKTVENILEKLKAKLDESEEVEE